MRDVVLNYQIKSYRLQLVQSLVYRHFIKIICNRSLLQCIPDNRLILFQSTTNNATNRLALNILIYNNLDQEDL